MIDFKYLTYNFDLPIMHVLQGSDSLFMDHVMFILTNAITWIPLYISLIYLVIKNNETAKQVIWVLVMAILSVVIADYVVDVMAKPVFLRYRPCQDPILKYSIEVVDNYRGGTYGFFSAHAANTMSVAFFFCLLVRSKLLSLFLVAWSLLNCYTRIYLGVHYPSDILVGIVWGLIVAAVAYFIYWYVDKKTNDQVHFISNQYTSTGYAYHDIYIVIITLLLTLLCAMFYAVF